MSEISPFHLSKTFVALENDSSARPLPVTERFWQDLTQGRLGAFARLLSYASYESDWNTWEKHPAGEEFVCLLEGEVTLLLELDGKQTQVNLREPGQYVLVPRDTWHTALIRRPSKMLFVTPGEGTQNRPK